MSKPANPLDTFRSYSYHHILAICDGTDAAEDLAEQGEQLISYYKTTNEHADISQRFTSRSTSRGRYAVIINGMSDAVFSIRSVSWKNIVIPSTSGGSALMAPALDGTMEIQEALGVNFLNVLSSAVRSFGTDPNGVIFFLKTIFVGITHNGTVEYITSIKPLLFNIIGINAVFDATGARYIINFVGVTNGVGHLQQNSSSFNKFTFSLGSGETIKTALQRLETEVNERYLVHKEDVREMLLKHGVNLEEEFFDVKYQFYVHPHFADMKAGVTSISTNQDTSNDESPISSQGDTITITQILDELMKSSLEVIEQSKERNNKKQVYTITSSLESNLSLTPKKYIVKYQIQPYDSIIIPKQQVSETNTPPLTDDEIQSKGVGIVFDYIFSGKNIDVLNFDMKIQQGLAFFQTLVSQSSLPNNSRAAITYGTDAETVIGTGLIDGPNEQTNQVIQKPLFLGMTPDESSIKNTRYPGKQASFNAILSRFAALEHIKAILTIRGNPQLMNDTLVLPKQLELDDEQDPTNRTIIIGDQQVSGALPPDQQPQVINTHLFRFPTYVKVNVYMPRPDALTTDPRIPQSDYTEPFWYRGWYFLFAITNEFNNGNFTQQLEIRSQPTDLTVGGDQTPTTSNDQQTTSAGQDVAQVANDTRTRARRPRASNTSQQTTTEQSPRTRRPRASDTTNTEAATDRTTNQARQIRRSRTQTD